MLSAAFIWAKTIGYLEQQLDAVTVATWFDDAELVELNEEHLILYTPSLLRRNVIMDRCKDYVEAVLKERFGLQAELLVWNDGELERHRQSRSGKPVWQDHPLFRFETFIAGTSNELPLKAAIHVAEHPGDPIYNPLFFYGAPGVGKTHLLYAIANRVSQTAPSAKIVLVRGEQFTNDLVQAIRRGSSEEFREKYRQADVLLVDDMQFIAGKEATQEEFFNTFNALYEMNKQIVLTSDRRPEDLATLEERLRGRFGTGVIVKIENPDRETRRQIIRAKAALLKLQLDVSAVDYIADTLRSNVRQIEGGLRKLRAWQDLGDMKLTPENIARTLADFQRSEEEVVVTPNAVLRQVCRYYGVEIDQVKGTQRSKNITEPRQVAMYLMHELLKMSLSEIGRYFGRDHTTVGHAVEKVETGCRKRDSSMSAHLCEIKTILTSGQ